ncbi:MAG TPA: hypothetical protein VGG97_23190 [Bryobacteraceae bacterium]|jgi:hypothetical protein
MAEQVSIVAKPSNYSPYKPEGHLPPLVIDADGTLLKTISYWSPWLRY